LQDKFISKNLNVELGSLPFFLT